jgi:hypothetical protein
MFETGVLSSLNIRLRIDWLRRLRLAGLSRLREVIVGDHLIMTSRDSLGVADPGTGDMLRVAVSQVRLPTGSQVVEDPSPRFEPCALDLNFETLPNVGSTQTSIAVHDELRHRLSEFETLRKIWPEFIEDRNRSFRLALFLCLWAADHHEAAA